MRVPPSASAPRRIPAGRAERPQPARFSLNVTAHSQAHISSRGRRDSARAARRPCRNRGATSGGRADRPPPVPSGRRRRPPAARGSAGARSGRARRGRMHGHLHGHFAVTPRQGATWPCRSITPKVLCCTVNGTRRLAANERGRVWGPSGRRFKSSRPDHRPTDTRWVFFLPSASDFSASPDPLAARVRARGFALFKPDGHNERCLSGK